jgi:hypothetical protein
MEVNQNCKNLESLLYIPKLQQGNSCRKAWNFWKQFSLILWHCPVNQTMCASIIGGFGRCGWMDHWLSDVISGSLALWRHFRLLSLSVTSYPTQKRDFSKSSQLTFWRHQNLFRYSKQVTSCSGVISLLLRHFCLWDLCLSEIFQCSFDLWDIYLCAKLLQDSVEVLSTKYTFLRCRSMGPYFYSHRNKEQNLF